MCGRQPRKIVIIDTESYQILGTIDVGGWPFGVEISPDGLRAYVAHRFKTPAEFDKASKASIIDVATSSGLMEVDVGRFGFDAVVSRDLLEILRGRISV